MTVEILHLSDIHFGGEDGLAVQAAAAFVRAARPDAVVVTGDLTLNGKPAEFKAARAFLESLPDPVIVTPGNHDTPYLNIPLRALRPFERYRRFIGDPDADLLAAPGLRAVALNTARGAQPRPDWSKGAVNLMRCRRAVETLAAGEPGSLRVLACHHPLLEPVNVPVTGGVRRGRSAAALLAAGGVDLVLTGHVHDPFAQPLPFGDGRTYAVGAGTLSRRLRGSPAGFNRICAGPDEILVTALGFDGSGFAPWRSWGLDRRPVGLVPPGIPVGEGADRGGDDAWIGEGQ